MSYSTLGTAASAPGAAQDPDRVIFAQRALVMAGFNPGPIVGALSPQTQQAVRDFQRDKGLRVSGVLDPQTEETLASAAGTVRPEQGGH